MKSSIAPINNDALTPAEESFASRMFCLLSLGGCTAIWMKYAVDMPDDLSALSWTVPLLLTMLYLVSLPCLKFLSNKYIQNPKSMLKETMVAYNIGQVSELSPYNILAILIYPDDNGIATTNKTPLC